MANVLGKLFNDIANSIRNKTGNTETIKPIDFPAQIDSIMGGGAEGCVIVTFMNGDEVLLTRPVYIGDDCPNPLTQGRIDTPTKESTVDTVYTYSGWSLTDGGSADTNSFSNVTEDRTVYAAYTESVRYYTVNFYDGETLLKTEQVAYGGSSSYTYRKDNHVFNGWNPEPTNITGDLDCYGAWEESYSFADASWEYIAQVSESGKASEVFSIGDTRTATVNNQTVTIEIIAFDTDVKADGSGKAGITMWIRDTKKILSASRYKSGNGINYTTQSFYTAIEDLINTFEDGLKAVIKDATKYIAINTYYGPMSITLKAWMLSAVEAGVSYSAPQSIINDNIYQKFSNTSKKVFGTKYSELKLGYDYWLRSNPGANFAYVDAYGTLGVDTSGGGASRYPSVCFCI